MNYVKQIKVDKHKRVLESKKGEGPIVVTSRILGPNKVDINNFSKKYSSKIFSNTQAPKFDKDSMSNPKAQGGVPNSQAIPTCKKCGRSHNGKCMPR